MHQLKLALRKIILLSIVLTSFQLNAQTRLQVTTGNTGTDTRTSFSASLGSAPQNGNTLIAVIAARSTTVESVDTIIQSGAVWKKAVFSLGTEGITTEIWYTSSLNNANTSITINQNNVRSAAVIMEYAGLLYAAPLDRFASYHNTSNSNAASTGPTATTTVGPELWIGGISLRSSGHTLSSITNSFTEITNAFSANATAANNARIYALERKVISTGIASTGGTSSVSNSRWSGAIATFKRLVTGFSPAFLCDNNRTVTITGEGFTNASAVHFNGVAANWPPTSINNTEIVIEAPTAATSGLISVTDSTGGIGYSESPLIIRKMTQPTSTITNTTCPAASDGALTLTNIPIALNFNATQSQHVNLNASLLNNLSGFTLEGWIKTSSYNRNSFFGQDNAIELGFAADGSIELWSEGLQTNLYSSISAYPRDGEWHHVAGVGNGQNMFIYIDGILVAQRTHNALSSPAFYGSSGATARIGGFIWSTGTPNYFNGQMLKVGFWNRALTSQEIVEKASMPFQYSSSDNGLIAGYNFFEGTGASLSRIPTGGNGTISGSPASTWTDISTYSWTKQGGGFSATTKNISGIGTGTYDVTVTIGNCAANTNSFEVVSDGEISVAATSISGTSTVCPNTEVELTLNGGTLGTNAQWKWYAGACGTNEILTGLNAGRNTLTITPSTTTTYYARAEGDCNTTDCVSFTVTVNATGTWLGTESTDWFDGLNWCGGVPDETKDVIIPSTLVGTHYPSIGANGAECKTLTIETGASVTMSGAYTFDVYGNFTNNGTFTPSTSSVTFKASGNVAGTSNTTFHNLTIDASQTLTGSSDTINVTGDWTNNGTYTNNSGTVVFNGTTAQDITGVTTFNNLKIDNEAGVIGKSDFTVNGVLNLASANPVVRPINPLYPDTLAALHMSPVYNVDSLTSSNTLFMGANATTIGVGDVNGRIVRDTIIANVDYTFGNANTTIRFYGTGTLPTQMKFIPRIGVRHTTKNNTVKRTYQIVRTGGTTPTLFSLKLAYLQTELDTLTESNLVFWDHHIPYDGTSPHEHGKTELNTINNTITLSGHGIRYIAENEYFGEEVYVANATQSRAKIWMISGKQSTADYIWLGAAGTGWTTRSNWSTGEAPTALNNVIIRNGTGPSNPTIPSDTTVAVKSITIESQRTLTIELGSTLEIHGSQADNDGTPSWNNLGTFVPNASTVEFKRNNASVAGTTQFYNISNMTDSTLVLLDGSQVSVSGTFTNNGTINGSFNGPSTFIYNGADQTVQAKENSKYHHLTLSGSGTKTIQSSNLVIQGDLTLNTADINPQSSTVVFNGTTPQTLSGSSSSALNSITLNNSNGLILAKNQTANGILTLTNGLITTGNNVLTLGCVATTEGQSINSYVNGKLAREYCAEVSKFFPIGKGGNYRPLTITRTTGETISSTIQSEQFESTIAGILPANTTAFSDRYWTITQPVGEQTYTIQIDGTDFTPSGTTVILKGNGLVEDTLNTIGATTPEYTTATGVSTFSDFTLGSECLPPTINTQPLAQTACELSSDTVKFIVSPEAGTYTYSWEVNTGSGWTTVSNGGVYSNATTASLSITNPPLSMNGYSYRALVARDCGGTATSNADTLTVNPQPQGSLSANSICKGEEGFLTWTKSVGTGTYTIIYNNGVGNDTVYNVVSGTPFSVGEITENTTFNLVSVADENCTRSSDFTQGSATVTVNPYITWTGATDTDWFTASNWCGGVPTLTDDVIIPDVTNEPEIAGAGAVTKSMIIENESSVTINGAYTLEMAGNLTNNGLLYAADGVLDIEEGFIENNGTINTKNTLPIRASYGGNIILSGTSAQTLNAGTYNNVIIENTAGVTLPAAATVNAQGTLEIKSGAKLEIGTRRTVNANIIDNKAGTSGILIKAAADQATGSLIFNNTIEQPVQATVQLYSPASWTGTTTKTYFWQYMGIPVTKVDNVDPTFYGAFVRKYNEPGWGETGDATNAPVKRWIQLFNGSSMNPIDGYELVQPSPKIYTFSGQLFNADIDSTLSYTPKNDILKRGQYPGQHVLSNPYATGIRISDIIFGNNMDSTVYIYNSGSYGQWNTDSSKVGSSAGKYTPATFQTAGTGGIPNEIPSMQGFLVRTNRAAEGSIYINYNNVKTPNIALQRAPRRKHTWLRLSMKGTTTGDGDVMWLFSNPTTTRGIDNGWDAVKILQVVAGTPVLYSRNETGSYQINALPDIHNTEILFRPGSRDAEYTITLNNENIESDYGNVYLFDIETGIITNINQDDTEYTFNGGSTANRVRFKILTSLPATTSTANVSKHNEVKVFSSNNYIFIDNGSGNNCTVELYDQTGRYLAAYKSESGSLQSIKTEFSPGVYMVKTTTELNSETTRIILK